jgi:uncharacterized Tic20 family protein
MSALAGLVVPFGNLIGPLLIWQIKKNEIPSVVEHGKAALNFQLTVLIAVLACVILGFALSFICVGVIFFPLAGAAALCGLIFAVIAGVKANDGKPYEYPWSLKLIN